MINTRIRSTSDAFFDADSEDCDLPINATIDVNEFRPKVYFAIAKFTSKHCVTIKDLHLNMKHGKLLLANQHLEMKMID